MRRPQNTQSQAGSHLEMCIPQRVFKQAVHADHRQHAPHQLAKRLSFGPGAVAPYPPQENGTYQNGDRYAQFDGQVQRQIVCVVEQAAKPHAGIIGHVMRIIQFAPSPAQPGFLVDQPQNIAPQHCASDADPTVLAFEPNQHVHAAIQVMQQIGG